MKHRPRMRIPSKRVLLHDGDVVRGALGGVKRVRYVRIFAPEHYQLYAMSAHRCFMLQSMIGRWRIFTPGRLLVEEQP